MGTDTDPTQQLADTIEFGQLAAQQAAAGDPIFAAIAAAQNVQAMAAAGDANVLTDPSIIAKAISDVYDAAANIRNAPDQPLKPTTFPAAPGAIPWPWIIAGVGVLGVGWWLFRGGGSR